MLIPEKDTRQGKSGSIGEVAIKIKCQIAFI